MHLYAYPCIDFTIHLNWRSL